MAFENMLDNPVFGDHAPLVLRWSDDQLKPLVARLAPLLPENLTDQMHFAIASVARSIVTEEKFSGRGVHYPRGKEAYRVPQRYRDGDPRFTWYYVTGAMDALLRAGLIEHAVGVWFPRTKGCQSVAWATEELMTLLGPLVDVTEHRGISKRVETIVLRDRVGKTEVDYVETADTIIMREQVRIVNDNLAQLELRHHGENFDIPIGRRIFNGSFDRGGRFYCHGTSFQNMPARQRRELEWIIDGTAHPTVVLTLAVSTHASWKFRQRGMPPDGLVAGHGGREVAFDVDVGVVGDVEHDFDDLAALLPAARTSAGPVADQSGPLQRRRRVMPIHPALPSAPIAALWLKQVAVKYEEFPGRGYLQLTPVWCAVDQALRPG